MATFKLIKFKAPCYVVSRHYVQRPPTKARNLQFVERNFSHACVFGCWGPTSGDGGILALHLALCPCGVSLKWFAQTFATFGVGHEMGIGDPLMDTPLDADGRGRET
ncbi:hypothetical protein ACLOJK_015790 [Asimina triloba]